MGRLDQNEGTIQGSLAYIITHFGDHVLHHLFPTVDHALLPGLRKIFLETCKEFEAEMKSYSWFSHIVGQHKQLTKIEPKIVARQELTRG